MGLLLRRLAGREAEPTPVLPIYTASRTRPPDRLIAVRHADLMAVSASLPDPTMLYRIRTEFTPVSCWIAAVAEGYDISVPSLDLSQDVVADLGGCSLRDRPHEWVTEGAGEGRHRGYRVCGGVP